ncbi:Polyprenyl synthetase [Ceraceosorus bombacis]|uniref:(2E,6E)-farnesyl diphosphate synthase n=1 Tax=Ceraceosorus bombacis TaxID=401625 RepID=A0A0P1B960_9BASI|nr:Polyprenyl synthetase [Ceraceosorus bombacis]
MSATSPRDKFLALFPKLSQELLGYLRAESMPAEAISWFEHNLQHNTPGGKLNRGLSVVDTVDILLCTDQQGNKLQAYFLVADDMMDASLTRRGQPCWYRVPGVGNIAINDAFMLEAAIYHLLKLHFRHRPYYGHLLELFHEVTFQTELAFYSFYLPVALAMRMVGINDESLYKRALDILLPLGEYFQDNKCSWNINIALENASPEQRAELDKHYGQRNSDSEAKVKAVFSASNIDVEARFKKYEKESHERLTQLIKELPQNPG